MRIYSLAFCFFLFASSALAQISLSSEIDNNFFLKGSTHGTNTLSGLIKELRSQHPHSHTIGVVLISSAPICQGPHCKFTAEPLELIHVDCTAAGAPCPGAKLNIHIWTGNSGSIDLKKNARLLVFLSAFSEEGVFHATGLATATPIKIEAVKQFLDFR